MQIYSPQSRSRNGSPRSNATPYTPNRSLSKTEDRMLNYSNSSPNSKKRRIPRLHQGLINTNSPRSLKTLQLDTIFEDEHQLQGGQPGEGLQQVKTFAMLIEQPSILE